MTLMNKLKIFFIVVLFPVLGHAQPYKIINNPYSHSGKQYVQAYPGVSTSTEIIAGTGLSGGGALTSDVTLNLANTAVTAGSYTNTALTVDAQGRLTAASSGTSVDPGTVANQMLYWDNAVGKWTYGTNLYFNNSVGSLVAPMGTVSNPGLAIGDGDSGVYESVDDQMRISTGGSDRLLLTSGGLSATLVTSWSLRFNDATDTVPVFVIGDDLNTGVGSVGADQLSLIAGGKEVTRLSWSSGPIVRDVYDGSAYSERFTNSSGNLSVNSTGGIIILNGLEMQSTSETVADDAFIDLTAAKSGWGTVNIGDNQEFSQFRFSADGTVTLINNTANVVNTDTDANLCIFDNGTHVRISNRLGGPLTLRLKAEYSN